MTMTMIKLNNKFSLKEKVQTIFWEVWLVDKISIDTNKNILYLVWFWNQKYEWLSEYQLDNIKSKKIWFDKY